MPKPNPAKRIEWKKKLIAWQGSGLSGPQWCKENIESYHKFCYWTRTLKMTSLRHSFKELQEEHPEILELELRLGDITISFPKGCSESLLDLCLKTLRKNQCLR